MNQMREHQVSKYHAAAKLIETDGVNGYRACAARYGTEIANTLIVAFLRRCENPNQQWPEPGDTEEKVNAILKKERIILSDELLKRAVIGTIEMKNLSNEDKAALILEYVR